MPATEKMFQIDISAGPSLDARKMTAVMLHYRNLGASAKIQGRTWEWIDG